MKDIVNRSFEYQFDIGRNIIVKTGDEVKAGQKIVEGAINIARIMNVAGTLSAQNYIVGEIKAIYSSQGQTVNSKHIELVVRQMFSRARVLDKGDTDFFPGDIVDVIKFKKENEKLLAEGKRTGVSERLLLGITKISLYTESWLSAASFQETVRVLTEASVSGKIDKLKELKENVIIGRLIPAGKQYKRVYNIDGHSLQDEYFDSKQDNDDMIVHHLDELIENDAIANDE